MRFTSIWRCVAAAGAVLVGCAVAAQDVGDPVRGQRLFLQCQACHSMQADAAVTIGPSLAGVVGRKAGSLSGYTYSPALAASGLTWDDSTLDQWLEHPNVVVPGTKMIFTGVAKRADRLSVIAYLKTAKPPAGR